MFKIKEKDLISKCIKGNAKAQKALYETHKHLMMGICMRYAKDRTEAQDILQEGFIKIYRDLPSYQPIKPLTAWMRTVMIHTAINYIKRERKKDRQVTDFRPELHNKQRYSNPTELKDNADYLVKTIQQLPDDYQLVFNLYAVEGYSHKEIAELLNITESLSKVRLLRARKKLQKMLQLTLKTKN